MKITSLLLNNNTNEAEPLTWQDKRKGTMTYGNVIRVEKTAKGGLFITFLRRTTSGEIKIERSLHKNVVWETVRTLGFNARHLNRNITTINSKKPISAGREIDESLSALV